MIFGHRNTSEWRILFAGILEIIWSISFFPISVALLMYLVYLLYLFWISMSLSPVIMNVPFHIDFTIDSTESSFSIYSSFLLFSELGWWNTPIRYAELFFLPWISTHKCSVDSSNFDMLLRSLINFYATTMFLVSISIGKFITRKSNIF